MSSKKFYLMLTKGNDEELVHVITQECHPNQFGDVTPPIMVEHNGTDYILKRQWNMAPNTYVYHPSKVVKLDDLMD